MCRASKGRAAASRVRAAQTDTVEHDGATPPALLYILGHVPETINSPLLKDLDARFFSYVSSHYGVKSGERQESSPPAVPPFVAHYDRTELNTCKLVRITGNRVVFLFLRECPQVSEVCNIFKSYISTQ